jgi:hypothetical protein
MAPRDEAPRSFVCCKARAPPLTELVLLSELTRHLPLVAYAPLVAIFVAVALVLVAARAAVGAARLTRLLSVDLTASHARPTVSVVVAARNEEHHIGAALASLCRLDYPGLEFVVVDDRSTDRTGLLVARAAADDDRIRAVRVESLPPRWLGKTHALAAGAARATGDLILFTDADVHFRPDALTRAVALMTARDLDHLSVLPAITSPSAGVRAVVAGFALFFLLFTRAWDVHRPGSRASIGIGAFNLVRARAYRAAGGHLSIRMRPDDDLQLGRLLKARGARADVTVGAGAIAVDWYPSVADLVRGLEKNSFAGLNYRTGAAVASVIALCAHAALFALPLISGGGWRIGAAVVCAAFVVAGAAAAVTVGLSPWYAALQPAAALFFAWVQARATWLTLARGGISWRGTFYPLSELKGGAEPYPPSGSKL